MDRILKYYLGKFQTRG